MQIQTILGLAVFFLFFNCNENKSKENKPLENKMLINDIWVLTEISESSISDEIEKRPQLEFNSKENSFSGNNGCNQISGSLNKLTNIDLQFNVIRETRMACPDMKLSSAFQKLLHETRQYEIKDLSLILMDSQGKILLVFKKID